MNEIVIIDQRFCGPPNSGNGGYVCGVTAGFIDGPAEVTLRRPPPLDQPLKIERIPADKVILRDGDILVAEAQPTSFELVIPEPPAYPEVEAAASRYTGFDDHPFPRCFVCGPERATADGLRIFSGPVQESKMVAAPWVPDIDLADEDGYVKPEFLWAALDCPGYFALGGGRRRVMLLGRMAARVERCIRPGERCIIIAWPIAADGRKRYAGSALISGSGKLCGQAKATWIEIEANWEQI